MIDMVMLCEWVCLSFLHFSRAVTLIIYLKARTRFLFVTLRSYRLFLAKAVCLRAHVRASYLSHFILLTVVLDWDNRPPSVVAQRDPIKHMHQRKPWNRAFSSAAIREYESIAAKRTRQLVGCLEDAVHQSGEKKRAVLDMALWFNYFA
jgi:hypothetical protein